MKIIEAMRTIKVLNDKNAGLIGKIQQYCADDGQGEPHYQTVENQKAKVSEWIQSRKDCIKEIERLRLGIQRTNLATVVKVELGGVPIEKSIAAWIHRRRDLAGSEKQSFDALSCRFQPQAMRDTEGNAFVVNPRKYYDLEKREKMLDILQSEPTLIDAALEIANATTEVIFE
jgi:hypothetical protein